VNVFRKRPIIGQIGPLHRHLDQRGRTETHHLADDIPGFGKPTVFVNVTNDMTIAREEIFGPVLCVITYETDEDAIRITNDTNFGLHAFVSGTDIERARRVASQILAGREFGTFGIEAFLEPRAILE
jgi:aldehyde dehydrogenase (NAD+)